MIAAQSFAKTMVLIATGSVVVVAAAVVIVDCVPPTEDDRKRVDQCAGFCSPHSFTYSLGGSTQGCHCQSRSECTR